MFPPRWMPAEHTFRPPWFHRNSMSEFMGMIWGEYDAKKAKPGASGFFPGGASLHNTMTPHGPDAGAFKAASNSPTHNNPVFFDKGLAFMFETSFMLQPTLAAHTAAGNEVPLDAEYASSWLPLPRQFNPAAVPRNAGDVEGKTANLLAWRAEAEAGASTN
eukprot:SAG31_NODE_13433_length_869_cov_2.314050_2_plen_161_part_00